MIKKAASAAIPFLFMHLICCGGLLILLISGGYLLLLRQEGTNKIFLIPFILLSIGLFWLYRYHGNCCRQKRSQTYSDKLVSISLYFFLSMALGLMFMIYVFIPWWIPGYKGGMLLP